MSRIDKAIISECIDGLGVYAQMLAKDGHNSSKIAEIRQLVEDLVGYWGLDYGAFSKPLDDYMADFDNRVDAGRAGAVVMDDIDESCSNIFYGLHLYGKEMVVAQGNSHMAEILQVGDKINEIIGYFEYDTRRYNDLANDLEAEVRDMLNELTLPGQELSEGNNIKGYVVKQAILFDNDRGFAYAHNPDAVSPYVTWQLTNDSGALDFYWGHYHSGEERALVDYVSRVSDYEGSYRVKEKAWPEPLTPEIPASDLLALESLKEKPLIRFIDSDYRELFKIPDGESIRVIYPPIDGCGVNERPCEFIDEHHTKIGGNVYHICQHAEALERIGAYCEPATQLRNVELLPFTPGEAKFYTYNREEGNTCAGSIHGDFGNSCEGDRYHAHWNSRENGLYTNEAQSELQSVIYALRQNILKDRDSMITYCQDRPEAMERSGKASDGKEYAIYGFKLETEQRQYFVSCFIQDRDSRFAVYAYADKPALEQSRDVREQDRISKEPAATNENRGYKSVLKAIEDGKKEPKPPRNVDLDKQQLVEHPTKRSKSKGDGSL